MSATRMGWVGLALFLGLGLSAVRAEDAPVPPVPLESEEALEDELEYTFGTVKSVGKDEIVITEFDYDTGDEREVTYAVDPKVELNNVAALKEIAAGDEVDIDFLLEGEKKTAKVISVAKPLPLPADEQ